MVRVYPAVYPVGTPSGVGKWLCCRAHDPEVDGSNPSPANRVYFIQIVYFIDLFLDLLFWVFSYEEERDYYKKRAVAIVSAAVTFLLLYLVGAQ